MMWVLIYLLNFSAFFLLYQKKKFTSRSYIKLCVKGYTSLLFVPCSNMAGSVWYLSLEIWYFVHHGLFCINFDLFKYYFILIRSSLKLYAQVKYFDCLTLAPSPGCDSQGVIYYCTSLFGEDQHHTTANRAHGANSLLLSNTNKDFSLSKECWKPEIFIPTAVIWPVLLVNTASLLHLVFSLPATDRLNF